MHASLCDLGQLNSGFSGPQFPHLYNGIINPCHLPTGWLGGPPERPSGSERFCRPGDQEGPQLLPSSVFAERSGGLQHRTSSARRAVGQVGGGQWVPAPPPGSPTFPPHSLGLQPGLRERGDDPGAPSAPRGGDAGADVRPPAHDPVRLPAQPGPRGPRQGALLRLLTAGPGPLARLPCVHTCPARACPPCPPFVTSLPHITRFGPGLSLAGLCLGGRPAGLAPEGPLWGQGSVNRWATTGPPSGRVPVWSSRVLTVMSGHRPCPSITPCPSHYSLEIDVNVQAAQSCRCQGHPLPSIGILTSCTSLPALGQARPQHLTLYDRTHRQARPASYKAAVGEGGWLRALPGGTWVPMRPPFSLAHPNT